MIDAKGLSCPQPVILTKKALKETPAGISIQVDNVCAVENISRFGNNSGYAVQVAQEGDTYTLTLSK